MRTNWEKALRLACWNTDSVRGRNLELGHYLAHNRVDIRLLTQEPFSSQNVCHRKNSLADGIETGILVGRSIDHSVVQVVFVRHIKSTAIHVILASEPVKTVAVYLSHSLPLIGTLPICLPWRLVFHLNSEKPQCQICGMERSALHDKGQVSAWQCQGNIPV